jgi:hypothetical protein
VQGVQDLFLQKKGVSVVEIYGIHYPRTVGLPTKEISELIRGDIEEALTRRDLPGKMVNYSVRTRTFAGGSAIDIRIKGLRPARLIVRGHEVASSANVVRLVKDIHESYNYHRSDMMSDYLDVNFYGDVTLEGATQ